MASFKTASFARQFARREILSPHINNWFTRGKYPDEIWIPIYPNKAKDDKFHPSGDAIPCARELYLNRRGEGEEFTPGLELQKTFMLGHFYHGLIYHIVQDLGFSQPEDIEEKVEMTLDGVPIKGHIDISGCVIPTHGDWMIDIKTQQAMQFAKDPGGALFEKYTAQAQIYMWLKDKANCLILWAEKDSPHRYKETIIERDDDFVEDVFEKWAYVIECEKSGELPECTCGEH